MTTSLIITHLAQLNGGRLLCIDWGAKNIGLALSDETQLIASPLTTLRHKNIKSTMEFLESIIAQWGIKAIIVGLPLHLNGDHGQSAEQVTAFRKKLEDKVHPIPVFLYDERWSSQTVERLMIDSNVSRHKRKLIVDQLAACYLLQGILDALKFQNP